MNQLQEEYVKAFRGEQADEGNDVNDQAPEGQAEEPAVAVVIDAVKAVDDAADEAGIPEGDAPQTDGEMAAQSEVDSDVTQEEMTPEEIQREKSWEGRLRKREAELAAREAELNAAKQPEVAMATGGDVGQEINDAEIAEIQQKLADDFGPEFVQMIVKLAAHEAKKMAMAGIDEKVGPINETLAQAIAEVSEAFQSMHLSAIKDAYEDFQEIIASPEFGSYIGALPEDQQAEAQRIIESGTAKEVIGLLSQFKASVEAAGKGDMEIPEVDNDDMALDAAESVRGSAPVKLPERAPVGDEDEYKSAWNSM